MEVRGQLCAQAALTFRESDPIAYGAGWWMGPRSVGGEKDLLLL